MYYTLVRMKQKSSIEQKPYTVYSYKTTLYCNDVYFMENGKTDVYYQKQTQLNTLTKQRA